VKPASFEYVRARDPAEACMHLARGDGDAKILAGGQSLVPMMKLRLARPSVLVDINDIKSLDYLNTADGYLAIGATQRFHSLEASKDFARLCPLGYAALPYVGHEATRNRGTLCGSLAHADPAAEFPVIASCLEAQLIVTGPSGSRAIQARDFHLSFFTTSLESVEMVTEARFPTIDGEVGWSFQELSKRHAKFALVAVTLRKDAAGAVATARIAIGAVAEVPIRATAAERALEGQPASEQTFREAAKLSVADLDPPGDVHGSGVFRKKAAGVLIERALVDAWRRLHGHAANSLRP
jgi:aerobic carbon-monoxide dehydrogenase medium subunit